MYDDDWEGLEHRFRSREVQQQVKLLVRLTKAELLVLARHYKIKYAESYFEGGASRAAKEELAFEIADRMVEQI